ncbi:hypothetical protein ACWGNE_29300, partial [Streptomyces xiamenensis]
GLLFMMPMTIGIMKSDYGPDWWSQIPTDELAKCRFCEWFKPGSTDPSVGCPGIQQSAAPRHGFESLIA